MEVTLPPAPPAETAPAQPPYQSLEPPVTGPAGDSLVPRRGLRGRAALGISAVVLVGILWSLLLSFPFFGHGADSYVVIGDTANVALPDRMWYPASHLSPFTGLWNPQGESGTDRLAGGLSQDGDLLPFALFPGWLAYGLIMWVQRAVAILAMYLLLRGVFRCDRLLSLGLGLLFALLTRSAATQSAWQGFAIWDGLALPALPLIPWLIWRSGGWRARWAYPAVVLAGLAYAWSSHFFLSSFALLAGAAVTLLLPRRGRRAWLPLAAFLLAWLVGEAQVLWAAAANAGASHRADWSGPVPWATSTAYTDKALMWLVQTLAVPLGLCAVAAIIGVVRRRWRVVGLAVLVGVFLAGTALVPDIRKVITAHAGFLSGFGWERISHPLSFLIILTAGAGLALLPARFGFHLRLPGRPARRAGIEVPGVGSAGGPQAADADGPRQTDAEEPRDDGGADGLRRPDDGGTRRQTEKRPRRVQAGEPRRAHVSVQALLGLAVVCFALVLSVQLVVRLERARATTPSYATLFERPEEKALAARIAGEGPGRVVTVYAFLNADRDKLLEPGYAWAYGLETADGYSNLYPESYKDFWEALFPTASGRTTQPIEFFRRGGSQVRLYTSTRNLRKPEGIRADLRWRMQLLSLANVRYFISPIRLWTSADYPIVPLMLDPASGRLVPQQLAPGQLARPAGPTPAGGQTIYIYENTKGLPRAFLAGTLQVFSSRADVLSKMKASGVRELSRSALAAAQDLPAEAAALLLRPPPRTGLNVPVGTSAITKNPTDELDVTTAAAKPSVLVVSMSYSSSWKAWIDGRRAPVMRTDYTFMGVVLPAGVHKVALKYEPPQRMWPIP